MTKRFVIGDIHARIEALKEVLVKSSFNYEEDLLILLGDIVDGGYNTYEVVEELLKIKNLVFVLGNHDTFLMNHMKTGWAEEIWVQQGGANTLRSYGAEVKEADFVSDNSFVNTGKMRILCTHQDFFNRGKYYYELDNMLFVHGGFYPDEGIKKTSKEVMIWDRGIIDYAREKPIPKYKKVFVGHTTTQFLGKYPEVKDCMAPVKFNNLIMMDCGAGYTGKLAIMDIDTEKFWVSKKQEPAIR